MNQQTLEEKLAYIEGYLEGTIDSFQRGQYKPEVLVTRLQYLVAYIKNGAKDFPVDTLQ